MSCLHLPSQSGDRPSQSRMTQLYWHVRLVLYMGTLACPSPSLSLSFSSGNLDRWLRCPGRARQPPLAYQQFNQVTRPRGESKAYSTTHSSFPRPSSWLHQWEKMSSMDLGIWKPSVNVRNVHRESCWAFFKVRDGFDPGPIWCKLLKLDGIQWERWGAV